METLSSFYTFLAQFHQRPRCIWANRVLKVSRNVIKTTCFGWCGLHQGHFRPRTSHVMLFFLPQSKPRDGLLFKPWIKIISRRTNQKLKHTLTKMLKTIFILIIYDELKNRNMSLQRGGKNSPHITATSHHRSKGPYKANQWGVSECMCYNLRPSHCH